MLPSAHTIYRKIEKGPKKKVRHFLSDNFYLVQNEYNIVFDIRTTTRIWLNQEEEILKIINRIGEDYNNSNYIFNIKIIERISYI